MRLAELAAAAGVSTATVKYYLREGLLAPGVRRSATESRYGDEHVRRLRLIRALREVVGLPVERIASVVAAIDDDTADDYHRLGEAVAALSDPGHARGADAGVPERFPLAVAALQELGMVVDAGYPAVGQLDRALAAAAEVGVPVDGERLRIYAEHTCAIAEYDIERIPDGALPSVEYSVLGTALHEPVLAALRRLAHQNLLAQRHSR